MRTSMLDGWMSSGSHGSRTSRPASTAARMSRSLSNMRRTLVGGCRRDEVEDVLGEFLSGVLLQEVPGVLDDGVGAALCTGQHGLEDRAHAAGDRVLVAERDQRGYGRRRQRGPRL